MFEINYRNKYQTENYGLGHFGRIRFQKILLSKYLLIFWDLVCKIVNLMYALKIEKRRFSNDENMMIE